MTEDNVDVKAACFLGLFPLYELQVIDRKYIRTLNPKRVTTDQQGERCVFIVHGAVNSLLTVLKKLHDDLSRCMDHTVYCLVSESTVSMVIV